jgi:tetratricopeptide (TPR) repeat protein
MAYLVLGSTLLRAGRAEEALMYHKKALRMDPLPQPWSLSQISAADFFLGNHEEAISLYARGLSLNPMDQYSRLSLVMNYVELGRMEEARAMAAEMLEIDPELNFLGCIKRSGRKDPVMAERLAEAWRKAGLDRKVTPD